MIGAPTIDPKRGDRRQKALAQAVMARLRAGAGGMSRLAKTGQGRGARTGVGTRPAAPGGGRPSGVLNFLSSKAPQGFGPSGVNYFSPPGQGLGSLPDVAPGIPGRLPDGMFPSGSPYFAPPPDGGNLGNDRMVLPSQRILGPDGVPTDSYGMPQYGAAPNGMIPLGGGVFLDPETGALRGSGLG